MVRLLFVLGTPSTLGANDMLPSRTTSVCCPRVRHRHSVYRWRRDWICLPAFHHIHGCVNWVRSKTHNHIILLCSAINRSALLPPPSRIMHSIGAMYFSSGNSIHKDIANGLETAIGESNYTSCSQASRSAQPQMTCPQVHPCYYSYPYSRDL